MIKDFHNNCSTHSDEKVWQALKANDKNALKTLFERHFDDLFIYAEKFCGDSELAEDHLQNLFLKIWEKRSNLGNVKGVKTYLWTALRRSLINVEEKKKTEKTYQNEVADSLYGMQFNVEELITYDELNNQKKHELQDALNQLSHTQREVLFLKFYEGMSYEEIEQIMSIGSQTTRNYVYKALKSLKEILIVKKSTRSQLSGVETLFKFIIISPFPLFHLLIS
ncbi:MAG: RNA polymerase sigma factor [Balneolales bacterium]